MDSMRRCDFGGFWDLDLGTSGANLVVLREGRLGIEGRRVNSGNNKASRGEIQRKNLLTSKKIAKR